MAAKKQATFNLNSDLGIEALADRLRDAVLMREKIGEFYDTTDKMIRFLENASIRRFLLHVGVIPDWDPEEILAFLRDIAAKRKV